MPQPAPIPTNNQRYLILIKYFLILFASIAIIYTIYYFTPTGFIPHPFGARSQITVVGVGAIKTNPNIAQFSVTVADSGETASKALDNAKKKAKDLTNTIKQQGLSESDINLTAFTVTPIDQDVYAADSDMTVTISTLFIAEDVLNAVLLTNASLSSPLTYTVNKESQQALTQQVRQKAIDDARTQAQEVAKSFHKRVGKMVSYTESAATTTGITAESSDDSENSNQLEISQTVQVTFQTK